jgi:hypothetical protein
MLPRDAAPDSYITRANSLYDKGTNNLFFWDYNTRNLYSQNWAAIRSLADKCFVNKLATEYSAEDLNVPNRHKILVFNGWDTSVQCPG